MASFVLSVRSVVDGQFAGGLGDVRYLISPLGRAPSPADEVSLDEWADAIVAAFPNGGGDLLFLIHGFNVCSEAAWVWSGRVAGGLQVHGDYTPVIVSFDWPSNGQLYAYLPDLDDAAKTAVDLVGAAIRPLLSRQAPNCRIRINALAHSMGAFVLRRALAHADDDGSSADWAIGQLALVAGDVEASGFSSGDPETCSMLQHAYRLTNYSNRYDEALMVSNAKRIGIEDRVGRVGLPADAPGSAVNVDCSARYEAIAHPPPEDIVDAGAFSHSWYFDDANFFRDLAETFKGRVDRNVVANRQPDPGGGLRLAV